MMSTKLSKLLVATVVIQFATNQAQAQYKQPSQYSRWEVGGGLSGFIYQGDLTPHRLGSIETIKPGLLLFGNYKLKPQLKLQASAAIGSLKGNDAVYSTPGYRKERNFLFTTPIKEFAIKVQYQIFKPYSEDEALLFPYISAGIGATFLNVKNDYSKLSNKLATAEPNILTGIAADVAHGTPKKIFFIPVTIGVRKMITPRIDFFYRS